MKTGDIVKFKDIIDKGDELARFEVLEIRGNRVLVRDINDKSILPATFVYHVNQLIKE